MHQCNVCWKMTRNKTNLLCARAFKNRPKRKETSILSSEQEMKARFMVMTHKSTVLPVEESSSCHSRVEADEVRLHEHVVSFLEQWGNSSEGVFSSVPACNQCFCIVVVKVFMEAAGRKCLKSGLHRTDFCIITTCHGTQIYSFFRCLTKKLWWWYLTSALLYPKSSWLILVIKDRNMVKGMKVQGCHEDKAEL